MIEVFFRIFSGTKKVSTPGEQEKGGWVRMEVGSLKAVKVEMLGKGLIRRRQLGSTLGKDDNAAEPTKGKSKDSEKDAPVLPRAWVL